MAHAIELSRTASKEGPRPLRWRTIVKTPPPNPPSSDSSSSDDPRLLGPATSNPKKKATRRRRHYGFKIVQAAATLKYGSGRKRPENNARRPDMNQVAACSTDSQDLAGVGRRHDLDHREVLVDPEEEETYASHSTVQIQQDGETGSWKGSDDDDESHHGFDAERSIMATASRFPLTVRYMDLSQKFTPLLELYDNRLCTIPLTSDCIANPLRCRRENSQGSRFLLHAILALSLHHISTHSKSAELASEVVSHHSSALMLYQSALNTPNVSLALLDTLLILMHIEMAETAISKWCVHIHGAYNLVEICGGVGAVDIISSKARAQILLLVWRDISLAFIHRQRPIFPQQYIQQLSEYDGIDGWSIFGLTGCPSSLIHIMPKLAWHANEFENDYAQTRRRLNQEEVERLIDTTKSLGNEFDLAYGGEDDVLKSPDKFHLFEAWRKGILLYATRVFAVESQSSTLLSRKTTYLSRLVLDHIRCIREETELRKQVLLPLFLAGAETKVEEDRKFCTSFCDGLAAQTTYQLFGDISNVLQQIWNRQHHDDDQWWGSFVSGRSQKDGGALNPVPQLLIG